MYSYPIELNYNWWTWRFLMHLVMVSDGWEHPKEASLKVSWILDIRKPVKTPHVLQVSSWGLWGHGGSWCNWWWSKIEENILEKLSWKFHEDWTSESLSRLHLSSKSLPGVLEDVEGPDAPGDGLRWMREHHIKVSLKVSWRLDIRNPLKLT